MSGEVLSSIYKVAILYNDNEGKNEDYYSFFEKIQRNKGLNVRTFSSKEEEAIRWLTEG